MRKILLALLLALGLQAPAFAACGSTVTFGSIASSTGADVTVTLPSHVANDILLIGIVVRDTNDTLTVSGWTQIATVDRSTTARYWWYGLRASSGSTTNPLIDKSTATGDTYAVAIGYRGCITTGTAWETVGTPATGTADPASLSAISTATANALVVVALMGEDNNNAAITATGTDPAAYTEHYAEDMTGSDGLATFSEAIRTAAGSTGTISVDFDTAVPIGWGAVVISLASAPCSGGPLAHMGAGAC